MKCKYCHKPAGLFSTKHKECEQKHSASIEEVKRVFQERLSKSSLIEYEDLKDELSTVISSGYIINAEFEEIILKNLNDFFLQKKWTNDATNLKNFIFSLPDNLKKSVICSKLYAEFWATYFFVIFSTLKDDDEKLEEHQTLLKEVKTNRTTSESVYSYLLMAFKTKLTTCLSDGIIDREEEEILNKFIVNSTLSESKLLYDSEAYHKFTQSLILRDLQEGKEVEKRLLVGNLPILLGKKEQLLWVFKGVKGYEEKTGRRYVGGSNGVSMRVCKGVYYRVGASKGHSVEYQYQNDLGNGVFIVTNKNIYFIGTKQVKLGISKILSFEPYSDGIVLVKDGANPKPYTFIGFDSWFVVNAMQLLAE